MTKLQRLVVKAIIVLVVIALPLSYFFINSNTSTIREGNFQEAKMAVAKYLDNGAITETIEILHVTNNGDCVFVLYRDNGFNKGGLVVFEKYGTFSNKYRAVARFSIEPGVSKPVLIGKSGVYAAYKGLPNYLTYGVVFGFNEDKQAHSYTIFLNSTTEYSRVIEDDYFIHIYYINRSGDHIQGLIYNDDGEIIQWL